MSIETLTDWNTRLGYCGCCPMPTCPTVVVSYEKKYSNVGSQGINATAGGSNPEYAPGTPFALNLWKTYLEVELSTTFTSVGDIFSTLGSTLLKRNTEVDGGDELIIKLSWTSHFDVNICGLPPTNETELVEYLGGFDITTNFYADYTYEDVGYRHISILNKVVTPRIPPVGADYDQVNTFTDLINPGLSYVQNLGATYPGAVASAVGADLIAAETYTRTDARNWEDWLAEALVLVLNSEDCWSAFGVGQGGIIKRARTTVTEPTTFIDDGSITSMYMRFRFRVPHTHLGTYYKITYDIAEFPEDGDASYFSEDNVVEWTGPGSGASSDPSWLTPWIVIEPPPFAGERRIVNIRYTCYHGEKFGVKPQVTGESFTPPAP